MSSDAHAALAEYDRARELHLMREVWADDLAATLRETLTDPREAFDAYCKAQGIQTYQEIQTGNDEEVKEWEKDLAKVRDSLADANARIAQSLELLQSWPEMQVYKVRDILTAPAADAHPESPAKSDRDRLAYLITSKRFHERGIQLAITDEDVAVAIPMAEFLLGEGLSFRDSEPPTEATREALEKLVSHAVRDSCWSEPHATTWARGGYRNDVPTLCDACKTLIASLPDSIRATLPNVDAARKGES